MTDIVNAYFKKHYPSDTSPSQFETEQWAGLGQMRRYIGKSDSSRIFPRMTCADSFSMSVQAHSGAYSSPRDDFADHYSKVEIGFPTAPEPLLTEYMDGGQDTDPTDTVYGYVPIEVVVAVIEKHGGLVDGAPTATMRVIPASADDFDLPEGSIKPVTQP